jgi:CDGSH-type Zn-finger protein
VSLDESTRPPRGPSPAPVEAGSTITVYEDGPYLVRGAYVVRAQDGVELQFARPTIALCRCGKSRMRPLCDGTHRQIKFRAPGSRELDSSAHPGVTSAAPAAPRAAAPTSASIVLRNAENAHRCLSQSLQGPCLAEDYALMRLAEPLVAAACSLLRWSVAGTSHAPPVHPAGVGTGVDESRKLVGNALSQAMRLPANVPRTDQVRSLLSDAVLALRSGARDSAPARGSAGRQP